VTANYPELTASIARYAVAGTLQNLRTQNSQISRTCFDLLHRSLSILLRFSLFLKEKVTSPILIDKSQDITEFFAIEMKDTNLALPDRSLILDATLCNLSRK
jgi:hypothetical protein